MRITWLLLLAAGALWGADGPALAAGRNRLDLRGQPQDVYYYRPAQTAGKGAVLFLPGDGGWRGFAVDMAESLARAGFDVYGWDVKQYLSGFTRGKQTLREREMGEDVARLAASLRTRGRITLVGWSQGAAMAVLAAGTPENQRTFSGAVLLGLPEAGVLGWRLADNLSYLTKGEPNEPKFATAPYLRRVAPLRLGMIHSSQDEYVTAETARKLFGLAAEPKRLDVVEARDHRYSGGRADFFRVLEEQVRWAAGNP